jgi:hypothetical protein
LALRVLLALDRLADVRGPIGSCLAAFDRALAIAAEQPPIPVEVHVHALVARGRGRRRVGELAEGMRDLESALALVQPGAMPALEGRVRLEMGVAAAEAGQASGARSASEHAVRLLREAGDVAGLADALVVLAAVDQREGRLADAESNLSEALSLLQDVGNVRGERAVRTTFAGLRLENSRTAAGRDRDAADGTIERELGRSSRSRVCCTNREVWTPHVRATRRRSPPRRHFRTAGWRGSASATAAPSASSWAV